MIRARGGGANYGAALQAVSAYARRELAFWGLPGMTVALIDADGFGAVLTLGYADTERRVSVAPSHLFQIGSISKSFTAATLLSFVDEGRLDLAQPIARYLPDLPLPPEPITVEQLLSHTAGLPGNASVFPRTPNGRLWCGYAPGIRWTYSNTGYELLGHLIGRLGDAPHPEVIRRRVLDRLGMADTQPVLSDRDRARYAVGYAPLIATRPYLPGQPLAPGPWTNFDAASGSIASTPDDMARYLRFLIGAARGKGGAVLSDVSAARFVRPLAEADEFGPGAHYSLGLATVPVGGAPCLHHTGGMLTFASSFHVDGAAGVACFASVNAQLDNGYRPRLVTSYAVELMRAVRGGGPVQAPDVAKVLRIVKPDALAGRYLAADGATLEVLTGGEGMMLVSGGQTGRLVRAGEGLATDHPRFGDAALQVARDGDRVTGLWWNEVLFARDRRAVQAPTPNRLRALTGWYQSTDPWVGGMRVLARGGVLVAAGLNGSVGEGGGTLVERDGYWTVGDKDRLERLRFDAVDNGRPWRLNASGLDMPRRTFA